MTRRLRQWLMRKWSRRIEPSLAEAYRLTFTGLHGEQVLAHLMDSIYCRPYEGHDPLELAMHNGRRSVIHEILENIDLAERPESYTITQETPYA